MGNKFTIEAWGKHYGHREYSMLQVWAGQSFIAAMWALWQVKRRGYGCVTLNWR